MNRVLLVGVLVVLGTLAFFSVNGSDKKELRTVSVPYYVHSHQAMAQPKAIYQEPPSTTQIKKDLNGKTIQIDGKSHALASNELNYICINNVNGDDRLVSLDVQVNSDVTLIQKYGIFNARQIRTHENVSGVIRINYERQDDLWVFKTTENIDATKKLIPRIN